MSLDKNNTSIKTNETLSEDIERQDQENIQQNKDNLQQNKDNAQLRQDNLEIRKEIRQSTTRIEQNANLISEAKKSLSIDNLLSSNYLVYLILAMIAIQKTSEILNAISNIIVFPKKISDSYNFITKEDVLLLNRLEDLMNQLLGITGGDRLAIAKIHNGTFDNTGSHEMKFSVIYEVLSNNAKSTKSKVQNIPLNRIKDEILLGSYNEYQTIQRSTLDTVCDGYLDKIGITTKHYKLLSINKVIYGILDIQYVSEPDTDFTKNKALEKRVIGITKDIEDCLQSIILDRNNIQKLFSKIFKINPMFK
jgi:hypothetical protein